MHVVSVPRRLRLAAGVFVLTIPLAAIETVIASQAPWWRLPYSSMAAWSAVVAALFLPSAFLLARGRGWLWPVCAFFSGLWVVLSAWFAIRVRMPSMAYFTLGLAAFLGIALMWVRRESRRSFFDPKMRWFEGLPRPIPGLSCKVGKHEDFRVSRMDREGAFVFRAAGDSVAGAFRGQAGEEVELAFAFRDRQVRCKGTPMRTLDETRGAGFRFRDLPPDLRKELGDFVELLRGEGYVAD